MVTHQEIFRFWSLISLVNHRKDRAVVRVTDHLQKRRRLGIKYTVMSSGGFLPALNVSATIREWEVTQNPECPRILQSGIDIWDLPSLFVLGICSQKAQPGPWPRHVDFLPLELDGRSLCQSGLISRESAQVHLQGTASPRMEADWVMPVALARYEFSQRRCSGRHPGCQVSAPVCYVAPLLFRHQPARGP